MGAAAAEVGMEFPRQVTAAAAVRPSEPPSGPAARETQNANSEGRERFCVTQRRGHGQDVGAAHVPIRRLLGQEEAVRVSDGRFLGHENGDV